MFNGMRLPFLDNGTFTKDNVIYREEILRKVCFKVMFNVLNIIMKRSQKLLSMNHRKDSSYYFYKIRNLNDNL